METARESSNPLLIRIAPVCGFLAAGIGFVALFGWVAGLPLLHSYGADRIPMAPSTALLFVLYGVAAVLRSRSHPDTVLHRIGKVVVYACTLASLLLFVLSCMGIHPQAEHLGIRIVGAVNGAPVGHMSPLTAFCFVLAGFSFLASHSSASLGRWRAAASLGFASIVVLTGFALVLAYLLGSPFLYGSGVIPPALSTSMGLLFLGMSILAASGEQVWPAGPLSDPSIRRAGYVLVLVFMALAAGIISAGHMYYRNHEKHHRKEMERQLNAVADLKVGELVQWRRERLGDASVFHGNPNFSGLVKRHLEAPQDMDARERLRTWLSKVQAAYQYDRVFLLDAKGVEQAAVPGTTESIAPHLLEESSRVVGAGQVSFLDFHRDAPDRPIHLAVVVPILAEQDGGRPLGLLVLRIDPSVYLYPFIQRWPTPSRTAETLLVRREGNEVVFLNELRFQKSTALNLRNSLEDVHMPAVKAALGQEGIVEGIDYRGMPVIACVRSVPDSPWFLVARMDAAEVYAPLRQKLWESVIFIGVLLLAAGTGVGLVWRQQQARFYRERYESAEALRERTELLQTIQDNAADGILLAESETRRFVSANKAMCSMLGYTVDELKGLSVEGIHPLEDLPRVIAEFDRQMKGEISLARDIPVKRRDGSVFVADVNSSPIELYGRPHVLGIFRDITERRRTEESLRESEAFVKTVLDNLPVGIAVNSVDPAVSFTYMNDNFPRLYRTTREKLAEADSFWEAVYEEPEFREEIKKRVLDDCASGEPGRMHWEDVPITRKGKETSFVTARNIPIPGKPLMISTVWDVTERKRSEGEKAKLQAELLQSQKLEAVGKLTGGIAHDFNNLLTPIIGNADMALSDLRADDPLHEVMEEIRNAGARAASLVRQLLAFSRKQILQPGILDLNGVLRDMEKMLRRIIGEDIDLETLLTPQLGRVEADVGQTEQVLMNLVVNARDAMPRGGKLTIETSNVDLDEAYARNHISVIPGRYVMLAISDTGVGMAKEVQAQLFEPFFTTKEKGKGTGLGLSTVYGIVKQSRGNIWVYSEPGRGSTFKIYLPRVEEPGRVVEKFEKKEEPLQGSETVLVVEDDKMVRNMTLKILQKYGYTVLCARDGQEALRISKEHKGFIDLMLTDIVMPGMSGKDLAEELKGIQPGLKVLFMSGYTDNAIVHHGILDEGIAFLQKPFTPEGLARKVREALGD
ncbi:MAG: PAS domain S-box protein [Thermodesulfobacteriota bacterium]